MTEQTDRELLERAAKAAGHAVEWRPMVASGEGGEWLAMKDGNGWIEWNPLTDDGDALRLAVKLRIDLQLFSLVPEAWRPQGIARAMVDRLGQARGVPVENDDPYAATRRAIVRAAAALSPSTGS